MHALDTRDRVVLGLAVALHLAIAVFPLSASGLLAPLWFLAMVAAGWLAGAYALWRLASTAPRRAWLVPVGLLAAWALLLTLGDWLLGWTA